MSSQHKGTHGALGKDTLSGYSSIIKWGLILGKLSLQHRSHELNRLGNHGDEQADTSIAYSLYLVVIEVLAENDDRTNNGYNAERKPQMRYCVGYLLPFYQFQNKELRGNMVHEQCALLAPICDYKEYHIWKRKSTEERISYYSYLIQEIVK